MEILKNNNFKKLMIGKATSIIGSNLQQFALSLYVFAMTGSATIFASMLAISTLPRILLSPIAGVFGDWFDRKKTIVRLDLLNGLIIGIYAIYFYLNNGLTITSIYVLVVLLEIVEIFFGSAMGAVVPSIVEKEELFQANSVRTMIGSAANIISPILASSLYGLLGLQVILIVNSISFILSALLELSIDIPKFNKEPEKVDFKNFKIDFLDGINLLKQQKLLLNIIAFGVFLNFSLSPLLSVGLIFIVIEMLGASEVQYGVISAIFASSLLISPILFGKRAQKIDIGKLLIMTFFVIGGIIVVLSYFTTSTFIGQFNNSLIPLIIVTSIMFITGLLVTVVNISLSTMFQTLVPREFLGRVGSVMDLGLIASIPIGQVLFGIVVDIYSPAFAVFLVGIIVLGATIYFRKPFLGINKEETQCDLNSIQSKVE
ncbi:MAG: MFS transporter [Clostridia bacterium]|nr:MFS transporter [Clostridia bacterium]